MMDTNTPNIDLDELDSGISPEMEEHLATLSENNKMMELRSLLEAMNPTDAAAALEFIQPEQRVPLFRSLPKDIAAAIFTYVDSDIRLRIVEEIASPQMNEKVRKDFYSMFEGLAVDDAIDVLDELPANLVEELLSQCTKERRALVNSILNYPPNSAGSLMTVEYIILPETITVAEALKAIRKQGTRKETIYNCYAVGPGRKLTGALTLRGILLSDQNETIDNIMTTPVVFAYTHDDQEEVAAKFQEYDLLAMPVVDKEERMVGIITIDDIVDVIEEENTEDFEKMAALRPSEDEYIKTGVLTLARNRIVWLMILMVSATFIEMLITHFNKLLESQVILAAFIPVLMGTGGNCGAQVSTLVIRGMAVGDIELDNWYKVVWKEFRVGFSVGIALCLANIVRMLIFNRDANATIITIVNLTLFIIVIFSKIIGGLLPMLAKKMKMDPAIMASPMITTIVDVSALGTYFLIAQRFLKL